MTEHGWNEDPLLHWWCFNIHVIRKKPLDYNKIADEIIPIFGTTIPSLLHTFRLYASSFPIMYPLQMPG
jgi:hypothetical protein